jgi:general secretion pathway protein N
MMRRHIFLSTAAGLLVVSGLVISAFAATSSNDVPSDETSPPSIDVELNPAKAAPAKVAPGRTTFGNPLWGIPLGSLSVSRERPIFSPSRRAAAPVVVSAPRNEPVMRVVRPPEPEHLNLALVGTVVSEAESIGVFLDQSTHLFVRMRTGEEHAGWILRSIKGREASLEKNSRTETLSLPTPQDASPRPPAGGDPE